MRLLAPRPAFIAPLLPWSLTLLVASSFPRAGVAAGPAPAAEAPAHPWVVARRVVTQGQGAWQYWQVDYRLRNDGPTPLVVAPGDVSARIEGWVSNSRVASHATPRLSRLTVCGPAGLPAI